MLTQTLTPTSPHYPTLLRAMHAPPNPLYYRGDLLALLAKPRVAIVGSRRMTPYGKAVTARLSRELSEQGVVIVSGLAFGVDAQAHTACLDASGCTLAVLPSPVENVAPTTHQQLSKRILANQGVLVSSYPAGSQNHKGNFVARNEIVAALSNAVIITDAAERSGSLHTASFAQNLGVPVFAIPGSLDMPGSAGANTLIKTNGAQLATSSRDILLALNIAEPVRQKLAPRAATPEQQCLLDLLHGGEQEGDALLTKSKLALQTYTHALTMLEIHGKIRPLGGNRWTLC